MRRWTLVVTMILAAVALAACVAERPDPPRWDDDARAEFVPLVMLMTRPEVYDGRSIITQGVISTGYHDRALFVSREDYDAYRVLNGVSVAMDAAPDDPDLRALEGRSVTVVGVFSEGISGHLGGSRGLIVARAISSDPTHQQLTFWRLIGVAPAQGMPWLMILALVSAATVAMAALQAVSSPFSAQPALSRIAWWGLLGGATLVVGWEVYLAFQFIPQIADLQIPLEFSVLTFGTAASGGIGLIGTWLAWRAGHRGLAVAFVALGLLFPVVRELRRTETWEAQLRYPFEPGHVTRTWASPTWPPDPMPHAGSHEDMNEPIPAYRDPPRAQPQASEPVDP